MFTKITQSRNKSLTVSDVKLLNKYTKEFMDECNSLVACDRPKMEDAIKKLYKVLKYKEPNIHWFDSPIPAQKEINKRLGNSFDQHVPTELLGNQDAYWVAFYLFCREIGIKFTKEQSKILDLWKETALYGGWWYAYDTDVFCVERPIEYKENEYVKYKDGMVLSLK